MWYLDMINLKNDFTLETHEFKTKEEAIEFKKGREHYNEKDIEYYLYDEEEKKRMEV